MTSVQAEAVREIAEAVGINFELTAEDTGVSAGEVFVDGVLVGATAPCWFVHLDGCPPFKDCIAAFAYVRITGGAKP